MKWYVEAYRIPAGSCEPIRSRYIPENNFENMSSWERLLVGFDNFCEKFTGELGD
jgi:hypothetical protein